MLSKSVEMTLHRKGTEKFIAADPTEIALTPSTETWVGGTKVLSAATAKAAQTFKVIWSGSQDGIAVTSQGKTRRFDFIIIGKYDSDIAIGDHWNVGDQHFQVEWVAPYNGYEVKAGGSSHGSKPTG